MSAYIKSAIYFPYP